MKFLLPAIIAASLLLPMWANAATPASSIATAEASTVIVFGDLFVHSEGSFMEPPSDTTEKDVPYCSGVLFSTGSDFDIVVTARHCVKKTTGADGAVNPTPLSVKFNDGAHYQVVGTDSAPNDDIGLLIVQKTSREAISINTNGVERGADYFAFSMPNGYAWSYTPASSMQGDKFSNSINPWKFTDLFTCPGCGPGDSGGGMFDDNGDLVGITVAGDGTYTLVVPSSRVISAVEGLLK